MAHALSLMQAASGAFPNNLAHLPYLNPVLTPEDLARIHGAEARGEFRPAPHSGVARGGGKGRRRMRQAAGGKEEEEGDGDVGDEEVGGGGGWGGGWIVCCAVPTPPPLLLAPSPTPTRRMRPGFEPHRLASIPFT